MAKTLSTMQELGSLAPDFSLPDTDGCITSYTDISGQHGTLIMFICNHCPYVIHIRKTLAAIAATYQKRGIGFAGINSNDALAYPDDGPEKMHSEKIANGYTFPYLYDESQGVAKAYQAACTPDFFLYDNNRQLVYRGQIDGSRPGNNILNDAKDLRAAMDALLEHQPISTTQVPSIGCNIKWKKGNEPKYFPTR